VSVRKQFEQQTIVSLAEYAETAEKGGFYKKDRFGFFFARSAVSAREKVLQSFLHRKKRLNRSPLNRQCRRICWS